MIQRENELTWEEWDVEISQLSLVMRCSVLNKVKQLQAAATQVTLI